MEPESPSVQLLPAAPNSILWGLRVQGCAAFHRMALQTVEDSSHHASASPEDLFSLASNSTPIPHCHSEKPLMPWTCALISPRGAQESPSNHTTQKALAREAQEGRNPAGSPSALCQVPRRAWKVCFLNLRSFWIVWILESSQNVSEEKLLMTSIKQTPNWRPINAQIILGKWKGSYILRVCKAKHFFSGVR